MALFAGLVFSAQPADFSYKAREFRSGIWINSAPLRLNALRGKVVVIDFWAFDCDLWPSQFVIDRDGIVRYSHGGLGRYDDIEKVVQNLLKDP